MAVVPGECTLGVRTTLRRGRGEVRPHKEVLRRMEWELAWLKKMSGRWGDRPLGRG
jgi:hypothetical protein